MDFSEKTPFSKRPLFPNPENSLARCLGWCPDPKKVNLCALFSLRAPSSNPTPKMPQTRTMVWVFRPQKLRPSLRAQILKNINLAWKFQSRLKISILSFRIPHKRKGVGGRLAWNFQSRLKISRSWIYSILGPWGVIWVSPFPSKYRVWGGLSFGPGFAVTMVWVSFREVRNTGVGVDEWALILAWFLESGGGGFRRQTFERFLPWKESVQKCPDRGNFHILKNRLPSALNHHKLKSGDLLLLSLS